MKKIIKHKNITKAVQEMALNIDSHYSRITYDSYSLNYDINLGYPVIIGIMNGSIMFLSDLCKNLKNHYLVYTLKTSKNTNTVNIANLDKQAIYNSPVLIVDCILDSGHTIHKVIDKVKELEPSSIKTAVLIHKDVNNPKYKIKPDFVGFNIPDHFIFGYGTDKDGLYRNCPDIYVEN